MSVRANWFADVAESTTADTDPFACHSTQLGLEIDLRDPEHLQGRLNELFVAEAALYNRGVTCAVRSQGDTACSACPVRRSDPLDVLTPLCDVGTEQERISTTLAVHAIERQRPDGATAI